MILDSFYSRFFHLFLISFLIAICYSNTFYSSWHFDDFNNILQNENIRISSLSWEEIKKTFLSPNSGKYSRSLALFTFALNYAISGYDTTSYHVVNISIHIICSIFVYLIFLHTLFLYRRSVGSPNVHISDQCIVLLGTILWAIHPIHTQAVTYIVQREASMAAMFYMVAMYCYIRFRQSQVKIARVIFIFLVFFFWLMGLGTKENVAMLPLVILGYEVAFYRRSIFKDKKFFIIITIIFIVVSTSAFLFMRGGIISYMESLYAPRVFTMWERLITQPIILSRYIFLLFCPIADFLVLESDIAHSSSLISSPVTLFANLFIFLITILSLVFLKKFPLLSFAFYFFIINHLVESSIIGLELYFEHRNYLPSMFIYFAASYYFVKLLSFYHRYDKLFMQGLLVCAMTFIIISEGNATFLRNDVWRDEISLHSDTIEKAPVNPRPYIAIAANNLKLGRYDDAFEYLRRAEKIYKNYPDRFQDNWIAMIYYNAGLVYKKKQEHEKAINVFMKTIQLDPSEWRGHINLGLLFFDQEDYEHAEDYIYNALYLNRNRPPVIYNLFGRMLYANESYDEAINVFREGLEKMELLPIRYNLAATYLKVGNIQSAKSVILTIPYDESKLDEVYYLYRALLFDEEEKAHSLGKVADLFLNRKFIYCEFVNDIKENKNPDLIFPSEFEIIEPELREVYQEKLAAFGKHIKDTACKADNCGVKLQDVCNEGQ